MNEKLDIVKLDCEERFGLPSAGWCGAGKFSSLILAVIFSAIIYGILSLLRIYCPGTTFIEMFFPGGAANRTYIPLLTVILAMWAAGMLTIKRSKLSAQRKAARLLSKYRVLDGELFKDQDTADYIVYAALDQKYRKLQTNGEPPSGIAAGLTQYCSDLEQDSAISFIPVSCFIWSVPVLGFIGTVLGLTQAVGNFGALTGANDKGSFDTVLPQVTSGLSTAFETTLIALVLALILQIAASFQNQAEAAFLQQMKNAVLNDPQTEDQDDSQA